MKTIKRQTGAAHGSLVADSKSRGRGLSLWSIGCTPALSVTQQRRCSCSCLLWRYISVIRSYTLLYIGSRCWSPDCRGVAFGLWCKRFVCRFSALRQPTDTRSARKASDTVSSKRLNTAPQCLDVVYPSLHGGGDIPTACTFLK